MNVDTKIMEKLEQSCYNAEYIFSKCREILISDYGNEFAEQNPEALATLVKAATAIFVQSSKE